MIQRETQAVLGGRERRRREACQCNKAAAAQSRVSSGKCLPTQEREVVKQFLKNVSLFRQEAHMRKQFIGVYSSSPSNVAHLLPRPPVTYAVQCLGRNVKCVFTWKELLKNRRLLGKVKCSPLHLGVRRAVHVWCSPCLKA